MRDGILGIDLGTSGVKVIVTKNGREQKIREGYESTDPKGWFDAICRATKVLDLSEVRAIGLSSQVGTYIYETENGVHTVGWRESVGTEEVEQLLNDIPQEVFIKEISMPHPRIISYPLPRISYIKKYHSVKNICQPKDYLIERLTGKRVTDKFSWRGLANLNTGEYSGELMRHVGIKSEMLPEITEPDSIAGYVTKEASELTGILEGVPVVTGCNDFFAGLLGMGMIEGGQMFDITGTSEHLGVVTKDTSIDTPLVCGPYFFENAHYGVTASSGASGTLARKMCSNENLLDCLTPDAPLFLPYLNGERAPIWDADAKGVWFGISADTTQKQLAYSALEGIVFSLYHIYEHMGNPPCTQITVAGGGAYDETLNRLKAAMFGVPIVILKQNDTSALGAMMLASVGVGDYADIKIAVEDCVRIERKINVSSSLTSMLRQRFEMFKRLYPALKGEFNIFKNLKGSMLK